ncbi:hypothetical protein SAMN05216316_1362 [Nitrosovibrio sp. Nv6]|nr:hypothetical protein SAMN05216316_1362 [Nitrosovibrio sp. Nv6]
MSIPMIKFERGRHHQFYLGLAVQVSDPLATVAPPEILQFCRHTGLGRPVGSLVEASEINASFMSGNISWESFNDSIRFESSLADFPDDLESLEARCTRELETGFWDQLLWWCSAQGEASFQLFRQVADLLSGGAETKPWHLMRRLTLQGHIEVDGSSQRMRWCANEPIFVCVSDGRAFLLGRQTPRYLKQVEGILELERFTPNGAPTLINAATSEVLALKSSLASLGISVANNPNRRWVSVLPNWATFVSSLKRDPDVREHSESFRIWDGSDFSPSNPSEAGVGLYEITGQHPSDKRVRLFNGKEWLVGPFYDLQWILGRLCERDMYAVLRADGMLLLPEAERWPLLYERALVLCSGRLPNRFWVGEQSYLGYLSVEPEAAVKLCDNLGIKLKKKETLV